MTRLFWLVSRVSPSFSFSIYLFSLSLSLARALAFSLYLLRMRWLIYLNCFYKTRHGRHVSYIFSLRRASFFIPFHVTVLPSSLFLLVFSLFDGHTLSLFFFYVLALTFFFLTLSDITFTCTLYPYRSSYTNSFPTYLSYQLSYFVYFLMHSDIVVNRFIADGRRPRRRNFNSIALCVRAMIYAMHSTFACAHTHSTTVPKGGGGRERKRERIRKRKIEEEDNIAFRLYLGFVGDAFVTLTGSFLFFIYSLAQSQPRTMSKRRRRAIYRLEIEERLQISKRNFASRSLATWRLFGNRSCLFRITISLTWLLFSERNVQFRAR